jgi:RAB6A-GEF complex partner protein 1
LAYFGHALEVLLHQVLEDEAELSVGTGHGKDAMICNATFTDTVTTNMKLNGNAGAVLPRVVKFLNHFPHALDVIVGCARKTEVALWDYLFSIVGSPKELFEVNFFTIHFFNC